MKPHNSILDLIEYCDKYSMIFTKQIEGLRLNAEPQIYLVTCLWLRIMELNNSIILLARNGHATNGFIILRSMTEASILLIHAVDDENFSKIFYNKVVKEKTKRLNSISKVLDQTTFTLTIEQINDLKKSFEGQIPSGEGSDYKMKDLFYKANQISLYEMTYCHCNAFVHTEASILARYLKESDNQLLLVENNSISEDTKLTCLMSSSLFFNIYEKYCKFIKYEPKGLDNYWKDFAIVQKGLEESSIKS